MLKALPTLAALRQRAARGTELPIRNASAPAAIGGKADPEQTTLGELDYTS